MGPGPGGRPTVFIGSYDGRFYALDAQSGRSRWTRHLGRKISGSASLIGDLVFVSDLGTKSSWALGAGTGATVWKTGRGAFNPVISDGRRIYFNGYSSLFALDPRHPLRPAPEEALSDRQDVRTTARARSPRLRARSAAIARAQAVRIPRDARPRTAAAHGCDAAGPR